MKIWKLVLGFLGLVGGLFAAGAAKSKEVKKLKKVIKENKKQEKKVEKQIKELEKAKTASNKEVGNLKRKHRKCKNLMIMMRLNQLRIFLETLLRVSEINYEDIKIFCNMFFCSILNQR